MKIGSKIAELREERNITKEQLAKDLNIGVNALIKWENNEVEPSVDVLILLTKYFNVSYEPLLNIKEKYFNEQTIAVKTTHNEQTVNALYNEANTFITKHTIPIFLAIVITIILVLKILFDKDMSTSTRVFSSIVSMIVIFPVFFLLSNLNKKIIIKENLKIINGVTNIFVFLEEKLLIKRYSAEIKSETIIDYKKLNKVIYSDNYIYIEAPKERKKFFQIDLNNFLIGSKDDLLEILQKNVKSTNEIKAYKSINQGESKKITNNKLLLSLLIALFLLSILLIIFVAFKLGVAHAELDDYNSARVSLNDMNKYLPLIIIYIITLVYSIVLGVKKYRSKLKVATFIIVPILMIYLVTITTIIPKTENYEYKKDYVEILYIGEDADVYLPDEALSVSRNSYVKLMGYVPNFYGYIRKHKVLITKDFENFNESVLSNNNWVDSMSANMKIRVNTQIRMEANYYLIYNKTTNSYNDGPLSNNKNEMYVFYYNVENKEIIIFNYFLNE